MAADLFGNFAGGIFGCPSCHDRELLPINEALKLFLPYFPLHIQRMITMYLKLWEWMHTFEMLQNMMEHMEEYQAMFRMFEGLGSSGSDSSNSSFPFHMLSPFSGSQGFSMPDPDSIQNMMKGSDLVDEFTYVEEPSGARGDGSEKTVPADKSF